MTGKSFAVSGAALCPGPTGIAIISFLLVSFVGVLLRPALPIDETRYLAVAWEMHLSGDWLVPTKNFGEYSDKPPLLFWAINLIWSLTGVNETAARMVGPAFGATALWLTARLARMLWPDVTGIGGQAALALVALPMFSVMGGLTMFDTALTVAVLAGLAMLIAAGNERRAGVVGFGVAMAFGVLVKGPVVLLHLLPAALLLPIWHPARPGWSRSLLIVAMGLLTCFGLVLLWLVPAAIHGGPDYCRAILWTQSAGRVTDSFAHARPWWFFVAMLPLMLCPWGWVPRLWQRAREVSWRTAGLSLCAIWGVSALLIFSLVSGKQLHYLFPELPAVALVAARLAASGAYHLRCAVRIFAAGAMLSLALALGASMVIALTGLHDRYNTARIGREIAPYEDQGIAWLGPLYNAEFNFAARLTRPVAELKPATVTAWISAHPGGVIIAAGNKFSPGWAAKQYILFRNRTYGIWVVPDPAPK